MTNTESQKLQVALQTIRKHLTRIHHDLNNPLSIVSGNVQLLRELATALEVGNDFDAPLRDIEAAIEQMSGTAEELVVVRNILAQFDGE